MSTSQLLFLVGLVGLVVYFLSLVVRTILAVAMSSGEVRSARLYRCLMGFLIWTAASVGFFFVVLLASAFQGGAAGFGQPNQSGFLTKIGEPAPDFEFEPIDGKPQRLSDLKGQTVVLDFFATWCRPCMEELPELDRQVARAFAGKEVVVVAIGIGHSRDEVAKFQGRNNQSPMLFVPDPNQAIFSKYTDVGSIPRTVMIKRDGTIGTQMVGYAPHEMAVLASLVAGDSKPRSAGE